MRIGIVSQWYPPEPGAHIQADLAAHLAARGHQVRVLTGFPHYPQGKIYPGYRQRWAEQSTTGRAAVRRVPLYPSHDSSLVRRATSYLSFAATSSVAAMRYLAGVDALYVYHPPATAFTAAALLRLRRRVPVVLHVQDVWPDSVDASSMVPHGLPGRLAHRGLAFTMRRLYAASAAVVVIAPSMRDIVVAHGAAPERVHTVLNWADESRLHPAPASDEARRAIGYRGRCTVMYAGNIGPMHGVPDAIRAAAAAGDQIDLVVVGSGLEEEQARSLAAELGADNVRFLGRRPPADMPALYPAADFQLIKLRDLPFLHGTISSKLQAALCCGSPVLASAPGDIARLVDDGGAGITCPPADWQALADGFRRAAALTPQARAEMGQRARQTYQRHMSRQAGVDRIEKLLVSAAEQGERRGTRPGAGVERAGRG